MTTIIVFVTTLLMQQPDAWPGFLGARSTPIQAESLPVDWAPDQHIAWEQPIPGHGQSSPVVWDDRVYVTSVAGPNKEHLHVLCLSLADGGTMWKHTVESTAPQKNSVYISRGAPTPVADEAGVVAYFESGDVIAYTASGEPMWQRSLSEDYGVPQNEFGLAASPVVLGNRIFILIDDAGPSYLIALDRQNGETVWKTDRTSRRSWSSPAIVSFDGSPQIVCSSDGSVDGYDPESGERLWTYEKVGGNTAVTPWSAGEGMFLIGASPGRGGENAAESKVSNGMLKVSRTGDNWTVEPAWTQDEAMSSFASPMVHDGYAYWVNRAGVLFCFDAKTGEQHYAQRIKQGGWATPLGVGDRLYVFGKSGVTTVLTAGPKFEVLAENTLWDVENPPLDDSLSGAQEEGERGRAAAMFSGSTQYGVAAVTGSLLVRIGNRLYCLRN